MLSFGVNVIRENPSLSLVVPAFRLVANLEALSWLGLLVGMLFKYVVAPEGEFGESAVTIFGAIHGGLVIAYVALGVTSALRLGWSRRTIALAIGATIPPFATVAFDRWAHLTGRYSEGG